MKNESEQKQPDPSPEKLKELGNAAVKNEKYEEAIIHYTFALKYDSSNSTLYSNRSYAFLKCKQYYFALQDANETIKLNPTWVKGYFRKGEVEYAAKHYTNACESYTQALRLKPEDPTLLEALNKCTKEYLADRKSNEVIPWLGAGIGIIVGVILVIADALLTPRPTHPLLMAFVTIIIAMIGYGVARVYRYNVTCNRKSSLDPPVDLFNENQKEKANQKEAPKQAPRYTKSQARQRYKKGKL